LLRRDIHHERLLPDFVAIQRIIGWNYNSEINRYTTGGVGLTNFTLYTQGSFSLCIGWCQQSQFPWLNTYVDGTGGASLSGGIS
jgi:hypothetical protein